MSGDDPFLDLPVLIRDLPELEPAFELPKLLLLFEDLEEGLELRLLDLAKSCRERNEINK